MNALLHDRALTFRNSLNHLSATGQQDAFVNEVLENNAVLSAPDRELSHLWELDLHGIHATGASQEEVCANWIRQADAALPIDSNTTADAA